jgi:uncharacterized phage-associated protein
MLYLKKGVNMVSVFDVVKFILKNVKQGTMTAMKLQKLVYYCQAWALAWEGKPLFKEKIEAWVNGPVVRELYIHYRRQYIIGDSLPEGCISNLTSEQKETILSVLKAYGDKSPQWLSDLTHMEKPWKNARKGLPDDCQTRQEISLADMEEYYSSLQSS